MTAAAKYCNAVDAAALAQERWKIIPAPRRGALIKKFGENVAVYQESLARMITSESRKILSEANGEVQEIVDICEFALGLSRQLYGLTMPSERANHRMQEVWQPLKPEMLCLWVIQQVLTFRVLFHRAAHILIHLMREIRICLSLVLIV